MKRYLLLFFTSILLVLPHVPLFSGEKAKKNAAGVEITLAGRYQGFDDPYSMPAGIGLFYEYILPGKYPLFLGADCEWYGFSPLEDEYDYSWMIIPAASFGYSFRRNFTGSSSLAFSPFIAVGQYFRTFTWNSKQYSGSRPHIKTGFDFALVTEKHYIFTVCFFYAFFMDETGISMPGFRNRAGYVF